MALTSDDIQAIAQLLDTKLAPINERLDRIETKVDKNYDLLERFYVEQQEVNTDTADQLDVISGKLEMHDNQIARNTADLRRIK